MTTFYFSKGGVYSVNADGHVPEGAIVPMELVNTDAQPSAHIASGGSLHVEVGSPGVGHFDQPTDPDDFRIVIFDGHHKRPFVR